MTWLQIQAGSDHLQQFTRRKPIDALAELIWNGLDAEADAVDVEIETDGLREGNRDVAFVRQIVVTDNGHGITPEKAMEAFPSLGDSWKRTLNGRTLNDVRVLHGSQGRGRFLAYALGHRVRWSSVSAGEDGLQRIQIDGNRERIAGFTIGGVTSDPGPVGTSVTIEVEQGKSLPALLRDDLVPQLAALFAAHLLGNRDIRIRANGVAVDPERHIVGDPVEIALDGLSAADLHGLEAPVLTVVDWNDDMRTAPGLVLCNAQGASLIEVEGTRQPGTVRSTGYLRWSGWAAGGADLLFSHVQHAPVVDAGTQALAQHIATRTGTLTGSIVTKLKDEGAYPYPDSTNGDAVQDLERQLFDIVAVTARRPLRSSNRQQLKMTARLLQLAIQERPAALDVILGEALSLSRSEQEELADLLRVSSLGEIVGAAAEVSRRGGPDERSAGRSRRIGRPGGGLGRKRGSSAAPRR